MTEEQLKQGQELLSIIINTQESLQNLYNLRGEIRESKENRFYDDGLYSLVISKYSDGSGKTTAKLHRYEGNVELLEVIITELERQLIRFKEEFSEL